MTPDLETVSYELVPADVTTWLRTHGWRLDGALENIAQLWRSDQTSIVVPLLPDAPDFSLRWGEMLRALAQRLDTDEAGVLLAVTRAGSDIAEFRAAGQIDDSLPLGDASTLIESVRRAVQASANSALQPRSYYGHSLPDAARDHASNVRMGQTRRGSYVIPVISRVPVLQPLDEADAVLFEEVTFQPFARSAMLRLAEGLGELRELTHGEKAPSRSRITAAVGRGVSSELCDAVANTLSTSSIRELDVAFTWAELLPARDIPARVRLEGDSVDVVREVSRFLRGEPVIGRQTLVGFVKRLDRGEEDEFGRVTLRILDTDRARNVTLDLADDEYRIAGVANNERRLVSVTGVLHREPGRALRFSEVSDFQMWEGLTTLPSSDQPD